MTFHEIYLTKVDLERLRLQKMARNGVWCAYQDGWYEDNSTIFYDELLHSSTNMDDPDTRLNVLSG